MQTSTSSVEVQYLVPEFVFLKIITGEDKLHLIHRKTYKICHALIRQAQTKGRGDEIEGIEGNHNDFQVGKMWLTMSKLSLSVIYLFLARKYKNEILKFTHDYNTNMKNLHESNVMILTSNNIHNILTRIRFFCANSLVAERSVQL